MASDNYQPSCPKWADRAAGKTAHFSKQHFKYQTVKAAQFTGTPKFSSKSDSLS